MSAHTHHAIDYIELTATDLDAAKAFYTKAFGWSLTDYGPDYAGIQGDGSEQGGLRRDGELRPPLVILYSDELEASVEAVTAAGGTIVEPIYSFPGGRRFHFADPAGTELAVWSDKT
jgi:predicted enzyme related to lactoylglutathione lyase